MFWKKYVLFLCYYCAVAYSKEHYAVSKCMAFDRQVSVQNVSRNAKFASFHLKFNNKEIDGQYHQIIPIDNLRRLYTWAISDENHGSKLVQLIIELSTFARNTYLQDGQNNFKFTMIPFNLVKGPKKLCCESCEKLQTDFQFIVDGENYSKLKRINEEIENGNIVKALDLLLQMIENTKRSCPYDYNEHNWRYVEDKDCYAINRHHSRHRRYVFKSLDDEMNITSMSKYMYTTHGIMGNETDHGGWSLAYEVQFPFSIGRKHYFYGHSTDTGYWFIQELLADGKMGPETDHGYWYFGYDIQFPFVVEGRQYFFGYSISGGQWFIQELLPDGKMGPQTDNGYWYYSYQAQFPFLINGKQYFFAQRFWDNSWFIAELLAGGKMGKQTDSGIWDHFYGVQFPFNIHGKQYFYGQHMLYDNWFIQQLLPGGKMGNATDWGDWNNAYPVQFPFSIDGQQFFYRQSRLSGNWVIQKLSPNGKMGEETNNGSWNHSYDVGFPFSIYDRQFFYSQNFYDASWFIQELL